MSTTRIDRQKLIVLWGLGLVLMLLAFGLPSLAARLMLLPGDAARLSILNDEDMSADDLSLLDMSRRGVVGWFNASGISNDLALVALRRAEIAEGDAAQPYLREAEMWQQRALSRTPADAYGWFRLAYLSLRMGNQAERAARAWEMSMASAPFEPRLLLARLQFGMRLESFINEDSKGRFPYMIRDLMVFDRDGLVRVARADAFVSVVGAALADEPDKLDDFRQQLAKEKKK